jgi:outer membrane murein-binding lipoprotein Lpp
MLEFVRVHLRLYLSLPALALLCVTGCRKQEQAVTQAATNAAQLEHKVQAASAQREQQRAQLERIALPTKSRYVDVHEPGAWSNPFLSVDEKMINLRITRADANPSTLGQGGLLRPNAARRQELQIRPQDLTEALIALPEGAWPYGRVVAIEESPLADKRQRPAIRRQIEAIIQQLSDLGVVVDEWPSR